MLKSKRDNFPFNAKNVDSAIVKFAGGLRSEIIDLLEPLVKEVLTKNEIKEGKKVVSKIDTRFTTSLLTDMMDAFAIRQSLEKNAKINSAKAADQIMELFFLENGSLKKK